MAKQRIDLDDVINSATRFVDDGGLDELALGKVAEDLGVRTSALYNHVDGVDGLRQVLSAQSSENLAELLRDAAVGRSGAAALEEVARAYRAFARDHAGQYASTLLPAQSSVEGAAAPHAEIVRVIARILEGFGLEGDQTVHGARIVRSTIHGFVTLEASESFVHPQDQDETFDALVAFLIQGLDAGHLTP
jgi:AcrR family transcriptional regulator